MLIKIRLLSDLKSGKIDLGIFLPPKVYVFIRHDNENDNYMLDGQIISKEEFSRIKKEVDLRNTAIKYYNLEKLLQNSEVIELVFKEGATIL